jgi:hypothetical protein
MTGILTDEEAHKKVIQLKSQISKTSDVLSKILPCIDM